MLTLRRRVVCGLLVAAASASLGLAPARADRSSANMDPAYMFEKAKQFDAPEAEKHGDFRLAEILRRGEARYYRVVAIPFHEKSAREFEAAGQKELAAWLTASKGHLL